VKQGDTATVVGHPLSQRWSLSKGVVSRILEASEWDDMKLEGFIQTDAAMNQGNSGGGVFDEHGHLIGICSFIRTTGWQPSNIGLGYATPIKNILRLR